MNFASLTFVLLFLPAVLAGFHALRGPRAGEWRMGFLILASAVFYAASGWQNAAVLALSIAANYAAGQALSANRVTTARARRAVLWLAVAVNLGLLLHFKLRILGGEGPDGFTAAEDVLLPLALSFVTFQQIGFVASCYRGRISGLTLPRYLFFVLFFPQLVLGPIVRYEHVARQLDDGALARVDPAWVATGLTVFSLALAKKVFLANALAIPADRVFSAALAGPVATADAWQAVAMFQLQLFFDFTAYAEMAIGLAMMLGMKIPLNFDRPLFARDRADLWRRWHISFAAFMRGNVFLPLAKDRRWPLPLALAVTGILSGLWHGLGATFVAWGLIQTGILLFLHFRTQRRRRTGGKPLPAVPAIALTFLVSCLIGALFRAPDLAAAGHVYGALAGFGSDVASVLTPETALLLLACMAAAWIGPDLGQLFRGQWQFVDLRHRAPPPPAHWSERWISYRPTAGWGAVTAGALIASLMALVVQGEASRFVYVQF